MFSKSVVVAALVIGGLAVPSVASAQTVPADSGHVRTIGVAANGTRVVVRDGSYLRIKLSTATDGGYGWYVTTRPGRTVARIESKTLKPVHHKHGVTGFGYHTFFLVKAHGAGTTRLALVERRANSSHAIKRFRLTIHVSK